MRTGTATHQNAGVGGRSAGDTVKSNGMDAPTEAASMCQSGSVEATT